MAETLPGKRQPFWSDPASPTTCPKLESDATADVAVVGGGICGLTAALLLSRAGRSVIVLEARRLGRQVTGHTTAKVTSQHALIYDKLIRTFGEDGARAYADANQAALEWIAAQVQNRNIACDFERKPAYAYCEQEKSVPQIENEVEAAQRLGLPAALVRNLTSPYPMLAAVRFGHQAQFHPIKYLNGIVAELQDLGCRLFENTRVTDVEDDAPCRVVTGSGTVTASEVIVATNLPILDRGGYFAKAAPYRHMVLAATLADAAKPLEGMYISVEPPSRSIRTAQGPNGIMLMAVGEAFKPGEADTADLTRKLEAWARERFDIRSTDYHWGNQDYFPSDHVPYVGKLLPGSEHVRIATGFQAWGMTNGTAAALMLADDILGRDNPWAETFRSTRIHPGAGGMQIVKENVQVAAHFIKDHTVGNAEGSLERLAPGEGGIVTAEGNEIAAYRDLAGKIHALSPVCAHLGCHVHWNSAELSWDCPCHGSRYDVDGRVLCGPTVKDLELIDPARPVGPPSGALS